LVQDFNKARPMHERQPLTVFGAPERHGKFIPLQESKCEEWSTWYKRFKTGVDKGGTYGLVGKRGTGKTQLGVSLMGHVYINKSQSVRYVKFMDLIDGLINDKFDRNDFTKPSLLVIDCIEVRKNSEYEIREINAIIDKRYDYKGKTTLLISNDTRDSLCSFIGASAVSRMKQEGGIVEFNGRSFRDE